MKLKDYKAIAEIIRSCTLSKGYSIRLYKKDIHRTNTEILKSRLADYFEKEDFKPYDRCMVSQFNKQEFLKDCQEVEE